MVLSEGWAIAEKPWRDPVTHSVGQAAFMCTPKKACLDGTFAEMADALGSTLANRTCAKGYGGALCSHCLVGFSTKRKSGRIRSCDKCDEGDDTKQAIIWIMLVLFGVVTFLLLAIKFAQRPAVRNASFADYRKMRKYQADLKARVCF